jgi:hypothetical protein
MLHELEISYGGIGWGGVRVKYAYLLKLLSRRCFQDLVLALGINRELRTRLVNVRHLDNAFDNGSCAVGSKNT